MLSKELLSMLLSLGWQPNVYTEEATIALRTLRAHHEINCRWNLNAWQLITRNMQVEEVIALIRGIIRAERESGWGGGSVSAVIWVFRILQRRFPSRSDEVADWVLANTRNEYLPFGGQNFGARSLAAYREANEHYAENKRLKLLVQKAQDEKTIQERVVFMEQRNRAIALRRSEVRQRIILECNEVSTRAQLVRIATDPLYPTNFYSTRCASAANENIIASLSKETILALLVKLKGRQRGPWLKLKKRLWGAESLI